MTDHAGLAKELFLRGYNCAQSVLVAFSDELGMERETAARLASSFGAGMGRLREVCGALSAVFMAAGLLYGYDTPGDDEEKAKHYQRIQELAAAFRQRHGTLLCRELLGRPQGPDDPTPEKRTEAYYAARPCPQLVHDAAAILDDYIAAHPRPKH